MILRIVLLLVVALIIYRTLNKWLRVPSPPKSREIEPARKCDTCGNYLLAGAPGPCERPDCPEL